MAKGPVESSLAHPDHCFVKELPGENPPSFSALETLYELTGHFFGLHPWELLDDSQLILVRDSVSGELCYCSVMGALGQVYSMHAYIGPESYRLYHKIAAEKLTDPGEFFAMQRSVYVEFVPRKELERQDRELLVWLGHPQGKGVRAPIFRSIRPGFHPWFVNAEEAQTLAECLRAVVVICSAVAGGKRAKFWDREEVYPMVSHVEGGENGYRIEQVKANVPGESPAVPALVDEQTMQKLRTQDYPIRGAMELDLVLTGAPIGKKNERKACACIALAADAASGIVYPPDLTASGGAAAADSLAKAFFNAVQMNRALPREVRVRNERSRKSLAPLLESFGVEIRVSPKLRAVDEARSHLLQFLGGGL